MSRRQRPSNANSETDFQGYRDMAPASIDDNKIRTLMKEHRNNKEKINDAISGWWESAETKVNVEVEEWVTTSKVKKQIPSGSANNSENHGPSDRYSGGGRGAGRGGARTAPAGGRGAGRDTGRGMNPASGRSSSPRMESNEVTISSVVSKTEASMSESAAPALPAASASKGNAWGQKKQAKVEVSQAVSESKAAPEPVRALPAPNLPADSLWNSVETAAQRIKRLEREKNQPAPAPPAVEAAIAPVSDADKNPKKKRERVKKNDKKDKAPAPATDSVVTGDETAPLQDASSLLDNLTIDAPAAADVESPSSPAKVKSSVSVDVEGSPKIGLKMGKWENKSERIDGPSLSFGSFGNATSLVAEESSVASTAWGAAASDASASDVPVSGGAVWSNGQQNDASTGGNNGNQNGPPGLGNGKTQRSAPGQSRNKNETQQNAQQSQVAYQQPPGFGAPGSRGSPLTNMAMPYGQPFEYMHPQFQTAPAPVPAAPTGASTGSTGTANMLNPVAPQQLQQGYAQPPGMAAPQFYNQNPYYAYQGMQPYYYGQAPVQQNYYGQHQPRGYQNGRGPNHGYADPYNGNAYTGVDAFGGQFGNAGQNGSQNNKSGKDASSQDQSAMQQPQQQQQQQQQYPQYMGGAPYQANPAAGWGGYNQTAMYGMYPSANPSAPQQGGRDNNRGYSNNYNNNNNSNGNNRSSSNDANAQTGYSSWGGR